MKLALKYVQFKCPFIGSYYLEILQTNPLEDISLLKVPEIKNMHL